MFKAGYKKHILEFIKPMGTSRGIMQTNEVSILSLQDQSHVGLGECSPLPGLSIDARPDFEEKLSAFCHEINTSKQLDEEKLKLYPSIRFAFESAKRDLETGGKQILFETDFTRGKQPIPINGLVVMNDTETMLREAFAKIDAGFDCIKIKIGALDFEKECELLAEIRKRFAPNKVQLRLDANGAFALSEALEKLQQLHQYHIHSIEQPISTSGSSSPMQMLCRKSPIPIALDEELIGIHDREEKEKLITTIRPAYLILKPTLLGGIAACEEWITLAKKHCIGYWITSALESNVGLNIIAQWTATLSPTMHQGLGTGQLYKKNFDGFLGIEKGSLWYKVEFTK